MKITHIKYIKNIKKDFDRLDDITKFRVVLTAIMSLVYAPIFPILTQFSYLMTFNIDSKVIPAAVVVGIFALVKSFSIRFNKKILDMFSLSGLFKAMIFVDILTAIGLLTYFTSPKLMVFVDSFIDVIGIVLGMAYRTAINNYVTYFHNSNYTRMQNVMTTVYSDAQSVGLILGVLVTLISVKWAILFFSLMIIVVSIWGIKYIKLFKKYDFLYMLHYKRNTKDKK